jgi:hypothetical protein
LLPSKYNGRPGAPASRRFVAARLAARALFVAGFLTAAPCRAQWVLGTWDDATVVPRGVLRAGVSPSWQRANERFARTGGDLEPLGADFTRDSLGPSIFPRLSSLSAPLAALTGLSSPALSLGRLRVAIEATEVETPIALEYGLTNRVSLGVVVPYVKTRAEVFTHANPTGTEGTLGLNPALAAPGARARNGLVVGELQTAASTLQAELLRCLTSADVSCAAINANRPAANGLVSSANAAASAVASVYGTTTVNGSLFAPVDRASLQQAVEARLAAMNAEFKSFLAAAPPSGDWIAARPVGAPPLAAADLQRVLTDSAFGIQAAPFTDIERSHLGDMELGAKMIVFGRNAGRVAGARGGGAGARLAIAGIVRLGTGRKDSPDDFADIGTGDGQSDIEARAFLDVLATQRWWASIVVRYGVQLADRVTVRLPAALGDPFPAAGRKVELNRDLGDYMELEVAPRFTPTESFSFSGNYRFRSKAADRYSGTVVLPSDGEGVAPADVAVLERFSAQREQRIGVAMTYSTLRGYAQRRAPWPLDVSLVHTQVLAGKGGLSKQFATGFAIRWYHQFAGRDAMREDRR